MHLERARQGEKQQLEAARAGQVTSVTDALSQTWQFGYVGGDLVSLTDPLSAVRTQFVDLAGRVIARTDPLGRVTRLAYDDVN